nr:MAG TPA: protein of unknown function (DUF4355) [Bacteriophage sp.]
MTRDEVKKILGENATEEQITNTLNALHNQTNALNKQIEDYKVKESKYSDYDDIKKQLEDINKANMSEQEKLQAQQEEAAKYLHEAKLIRNKAKVMEILAGKGFDEEIIDSIVGEDENLSVAKAQKLVERLDTVIADTKKKTEEELANLNVKPNLTNTNPNSDGAMNWEKFSKLSQEEQNKFAEENPEEFAKL